MYASYLGATHIHSETIETVDNCKICVVADSLNYADIPHVDSSYVIVEDNFLEIFYKKDFYKIYIYKGFNSTAPPSFS